MRSEDKTVNLSHGKRIEEIGQSSTKGDIGEDQSPEILETSDHQQEVMDSH